MQEALLAAATQWPEHGVPDEPRTWLIRVASRRLVDLLRSEQARSRREAAWRPPVATAPDQDDSLTLLFLCCHPALTPAAQLALTLRAVGGLSTAEIARALLTPEATVAQRVSRAKAKIRAAGATFRLPAPGEFDERLDVVLAVLYLVCTEGYVGTAGDTLDRVELAAEAIRLTRLLHARIPGRGDVTGLLALMLLTHARRAARTRDGALVPLDEQDRSRWDRTAIEEGTALAAAALHAGPAGPFQLQAAIAAVHAEAATAADTDWRQILGLYRLLETVTGNPVVTVNRAVAAAKVHGPAAGLAVLDAVAGDPRLERSHRPAAVRAHLLAMSGRRAEAGHWYRVAARLTTNRYEQRHLLSRAALHEPGPLHEPAALHQQDQGDDADQGAGDAGEERPGRVPGERLALRVGEERRHAQEPAGDHPAGAEPRRDERHREPPPRPPPVHQNQQPDRRAQELRRGHRVLQPQPRVAARARAQPAVPPNTHDSRSAASPAAITAASHASGTCTAWVSRRGARPKVPPATGRNRSRAYSSNATARATPSTTKLPYTTTNVHGHRVGSPGAAGGGFHHPAACSAAPAGLSTTNGASSPAPIHTGTRIARMPRGRIAASATATPATASPSVTRLSVTQPARGTPPRSVIPAAPPATQSPCSATYTAAAPTAVHPAAVRPRLMPTVSPSVTVTALSRPEPGLSDRRRSRRPSRS
ncbi:DUF6596 domain-containing protein, partial [Dactylosporangium sp. NPDC050688]|uniref:RNA polymerase sigma factor n=1 Tax=Dactylosporangium sp. NPDC050688 TaxID=3157217 RepID=UPI00340037D5